jgi:hypothetical protein
LKRGVERICCCCCCDDCCAVGVDGLGVEVDLDDGVDACLVGVEGFLALVGVLAALEASPGAVDAEPALGGLRELEDAMRRHGQAVEIGGVKLLTRACFVR